MLLYGKCTRALTFENVWQARTVFDIHNMGYCGNFKVPDPQVCVCVSVKRDLSFGKRDLQILRKLQGPRSSGMRMRKCQKRPAMWEKRPIIHTNEPY